MWLLFTDLAWGRAAPIVPMLFVTPAVTFTAQPPVGFPLMERVVYQQMAELDQRHWWYRARREVIAALIRRLVDPPIGANVLEIGCGTGHNLAMLGEFGRVDALELDEEARTFAEQRLGRSVMSAPLPELAGVLDAQYDLIGAFDVIEHIDDDRAAIASIAAKLKPGGKFVMTVPAHAVDVVGARCREPSQAPLFEASAAATDRKLAAPARKRSAISTACSFPPQSPSACPPRLRGKDECGPDASAGTRSTLPSNAPSPPSVT